MKNCDEMVNSLFERREQYTVEKRKKRKAAMRISSVLCCILLLTVVCVGVWHRETSDIPKNTTHEGPYIPGEDEMSEYSIIWGDSDNEAEDECIIEEWNGKQVACSLITAMQNAPQNSKVAIMARTHIDENFIYNGKSLAEYFDEAEAERIFPEKILLLLKVGDALKHGEALYQTGTPDGEKWAQSLYEETIEFIGEDLLSKYIVDGVFLTDKAVADAETALNEKTAQNAYKLACHAYFEYTMDEITKQIDKKNIDFDKKDNAEYLIIYASESEFASFSFDGIENWYFTLAIENQGDSAGWDFLQDFDENCVDE